MIRYALSAVLAYLLGSVSTGLITARLFHGPDLRSTGSKNTGASNVLRTMGWKAGLITFFGDYFKAIIACLAGLWITGDERMKLICGLLVILGHNWPVFFGFKGGKGVASSCGVMIVCFPVPALIGYLTAIIVIAATKYISLGSMSMLAVFAILTSVFFSGGSGLIISWAIILALLCILRHRTNIIRLISGNENKFGQKLNTEH